MGFWFYPGCTVRPLGESEPGNSISSFCWISLFVCLCAVKPSFLTTHCLWHPGITHLISVKLYIEVRVKEIRL